MKAQIAAKTEFGDFQTPLELAREVCRLLKGLGVAPQIVVEPTCGSGGFLLAASEVFPATERLLGFDINPEHLARAEKAWREAKPESSTATARFVQADFFKTDWATALASEADGVFLLGNPPWVTNAVLSSSGSANLPAKSNFQNHAGFAAKTGKANFDISEWMLIKLLEAMRQKRGWLAMLVKTATARKVVRHAWLNGLPIGESAIYRIDSAHHFDIAADASLLFCRLDGTNGPIKTALYDSLATGHPRSIMGLTGRDLVADIETFEKVRDLEGVEYFRWRSGLKHDCAKVMELTVGDSGFRNGFGEEIHLESDSIFPLLKSSDLGNARLAPTRHVVVPQREIQEDTASLAQSRPLTWAYLTEHGALLDGRKSSIYTDRPRFSLFGIGGYTFAPWKVAVSSLYRNCAFHVVGPVEGKPVLFDDTCYFLAFMREQDAKLVCEALNSGPARSFFKSLSFFDSKRAVTIDVLKRLDLWKTADRIGKGPQMADLIGENHIPESAQRMLILQDSTSRKA